MILYLLFALNDSLRHDFWVFFAWPDGSVWSNMVAEVICIGIAGLWAMRKLLNKQEEQHQERMQQQTEHHLAVLDKIEEHHAQHMEKLNDIHKTVTSGTSPEVK